MSGAKTTAQIEWAEKMSFNVEINGHKMVIDALENVGGENNGPQPKPLLLVALGGCTSMDVISILAKMRVTPEDFRVEVIGEQTNEHPKHYNKLHIKYFFKGKDLPKDKIEKAIHLSQERYCGVSAMLGKAAELSHEFFIES